MSGQFDEQDSGSRRATRVATIGTSLGALACGGAGLLLLSQTGSMAAAALGVCVAALALGVWSHSSAGRNFKLLHRIQDSLQQFGGGGSLEKIDESGLGNGFTPIAREFNQIFDALGTSSASVVSMVERTSGLGERIGEAMRDIEISADAQEEAVEETASLIANINNLMRDINERIERLERAAGDSSSSILQMGSSIEEVARNAATLHENVDSTTSAVHEMGTSIRQVADSAEHLERIAEETASSMLEMDRVVEQVSGNAHEASKLTQTVTDGAELGSHAVAETISDIQLIHDRTTEARDVLGKLVERISEIGNILDGIGEINDETNLLSLNAAIIAAQAGEQGKAFLVVANHVKTLARRTASSTTDIEKLIVDVQKESVDAVNAMNSGIDAIETGVKRSQAAEDALSAILQSAREAYTRVDGIARSTDEQSRSSKLVARAAQDTSSQVQQISAAMAEQSKVSEGMLKRAEAALDSCRHVHRSTDEQRETGRYITESISSITEMIRLIRENAVNHSTASESVSEAVMRLLDNAQKSGQQVPAINAMLADLRTGGEQIVAVLSRLEGRTASLEKASSPPPPQ